MSWLSRAKRVVTRAARPRPPVEPTERPPTETAVPETAQGYVPPEELGGVVPDRVIVFLHVPKTAGTSLRDFMFEAIRPGLLAPERHRFPDEMTADEIVGLSNYRAFAGHFDVIDLGKFPGPQAVFTVLRDPADMLVSLYDFWRAHDPAFIEEHDLVGPRLARSQPFEEFVGGVDPRIVPDLDNTLVRTFTGRIRSNDPLDDPEALLAEAIARLESFAHVGHVTELERTFRWLGAELGVESAVPERRSNVRGQWTADHLHNVDRTEVTPAAREALRPLSELDDRLVAHFFPAAGQNR